MKFLIVFALAFATVSAKNLYFRSIEVSLLENEGRIINGKNAKPGQFNYQVGLCMIKGSYTKWCGSSFIGNNWVLTAAHCTDGALLAVVYLGATQRFDTEEVYHAPKSDMLIHPDWNSRSMSNDISLIRIPTTSESVRIEIVNTSSNNDLKYLGDIVIISCWGYTNLSTNVLSNNLQCGILEVSPGSVCSEVYKSSFSDDINICVTLRPNRVFTCRGDSVGPLVLNRQKIQIGILSFGSRRGCAKGGPLAFTRVSDYLPWIKLHIERNYQTSKL